MWCVISFTLILKNKLIIWSCRQKLPLVRHKRILSNKLCVNTCVYEVKTSNVSLCKARNGGCQERRRFKQSEESRCASQEPRLFHKFGAGRWENWAWGGEKAYKFSKCVSVGWITGPKAKLGVNQTFLGELSILFLHVLWTLCIYKT